MGKYLSGKSDWLASVKLSDGIARQARKRFAGLILLPHDTKRLRLSASLLGPDRIDQRLIAALAVVAATLAAVLGAAPAHADECFAPNHHWDGSRGYCVPDSYGPPPFPNYQHPHGWYNTNP